MADVQVVRLEQVGSTQDEARTRFEDNPVLVLAQRQNRGRGRHGRTWMSAPRALAASLAFSPPWSPDTWGRLSLVAGLAGVSVLPGNPDVKWPNDLLTGRGKVGGILLEASGGVVVAGIGANLYWPDPPAGSAALLSEDPGPDRAGEIGMEWSVELLRRVGYGPEGWGRAEYVAACTTLGRDITWEPEGRGRAVDVAPDGALVVETSSGIVRLVATEVSHVR
jgi:BirA family biotin operon repressor/biotin-[acetyl-CoA-carboxylase] ligase